MDKNIPISLTLARAAHYCLLARTVVYYLLANLIGFYPLCMYLSLCFVLSFIIARLIFTHYLVTYTEFVAFAING